MVGRTCSQMYILLGRSYICLWNVFFSVRELNMTLIAMTSFLTSKYRHKTS